MAKRSNTNGNLSWMPRTRTGRIAVGVLALCCLLGSAYVLNESTSRADKDAEGFVNKYQYVDQSAYRTKR